MGMNKDFSVLIKSGHVLYCFTCVIYCRLKAFGKKRENKTHGKISHSTELVIYSDVKYTRNVETSESKNIAHFLV